MQWVKRGPKRTPSRTGTWVASDYTDIKGVDFNVNWDIRHGPTGGNGTYVGATGLRVEYTEGNPSKTYYQIGTFSPNCTTISWVVPAGAPADLAGDWCKVIQSHPEVCVVRCAL